MFKFSYLLSLIAVCLLAILTACSGKPNQTNTTPTANKTSPTLAPQSTPVNQGILVYVDSLELQIDSANPANLIALVKGNLADGCTTIGTETQQLPLGDSNVFLIELNPIRPADAMCTEALVPFERLIPLKTNALPSGNYVLEVHGVTAEFSIP
jgi:inhibitor of cysteine peptidase